MKLATGWRSRLFSCKGFIYLFFSLPPCSFKVVPRKCKLECTRKPFRQKWEQPVSGQTGTQRCTLFKRKSVSVHGYFQLKYSGCVFFRPLPGGRAQRVGRTRRQGSLWAVPAEPPLLPLAAGCLRIGRMEVSLTFFSLRNAIQPRKTFQLQRKCQYSDCMWHNYGIAVITLNPSPSVDRIYLFGAKCDIINISDIWTLCLWLFF